jgi:hypothetical protein
MQQVLGGRRGVTLPQAVVFTILNLIAVSALPSPSGVAEDVSTGVLSRFRYPKPND